MSTRSMVFLSGGKRYSGESAIEIVRELERAAADYPQRRQSLRQFLLWSLDKLRAQLHPRELDLSDRLGDEALALNYLYLCDQYGVGKLEDSGLDDSGPPAREIISPLCGEGVR